MKYLLPEYLDFGFDKEWEASCKEYNEYIEANEKNFTNKFLQDYKNDGFHDYNIRKVNLNFQESAQGCSLNVVINLEKNGKEYFFIHNDVKDLTVSMSAIKNIFLYEYLYGEYYKDANNLWHHNFLFGNSYEINITCKNFIYRT